MSKNPLDTSSSEDKKLYIYLVLGIFFIVEFVQSGESFSRPAYISALWVLSNQLIFILKEKGINLRLVAIIPGYFGTLYFAYWLILIFSSFALHNIEAAVVNPRSNLMGGGDMLLQYENYPEIIKIIYIIFLDTIARVLYRHFVKNKSLLDHSNDSLTKSALIIMIEVLLAVGLMGITVFAYLFLWILFLKS